MSGAFDHMEEEEEAVNPPEHGEEAPADRSFRSRKREDRWRRDDELRLVLGYRDCEGQSSGTYSVGIVVVHPL